MDHCAGGAGPLRESRNVVSERVIVDLVNEDAEEGGSLDVGIGPELRVYSDDERRSDSGE